MPIPGDLWKGCLSLGDDDELLAALKLLRETDAESNRTQGVLEHARAIVLDRALEALASPEGRRLYCGAVAADLEGMLIEVQKPLGEKSS